MKDSSRKRLLGVNEEIFLNTQQHWFVLVREIAVEVLLALAIIFLVTFVWIVWAQSALITLGYLILILPAISLIRDWAQWRSHRYIVTNRRVIQLSGVFDRNISDSSLEKVNDVRLVQSFWGRLFDYGDVEVITGSDLGTNRFAKIANPLRFKTAMLDASVQLEKDTPTPPSTSTDAAMLLAELGALYRDGVLTEDEFNTKKSELLTRM